MKTFRLIGMVLIAFFMGVNFVACSEDEDAPTNENYELSKSLVGKWTADGYDGFMDVRRSECAGTSIHLFQDDVHTK